MATYVCSVKCLETRRQDRTDYLQTDGCGFEYLLCFVVKTGNTVHNTDKKCSQFAVITWRKDSRFLGYCPMFGGATHKWSYSALHSEHPHPPYSYRDIKMPDVPWFWASTWTPLITLVHFPAKPKKYFLSETSTQPPNKLVPGPFVWCAP